MAETTLTPNTTTTTDYRIPEMWDDWVIRFRERKLRAAQFFRRADATISAEGNLIHFPQISERTAQTFTQGGSLYDDLDPQTDTGVNMTIGTYIVSPFLLLDIASTQSHYDEKAIEYQTSAYAIAKKLDSDVLADCVNYTTTDINEAGDAFTNKDATTAQQTLDLNDVPEEDRQWFMTPKARKDLLDLTGNYFSSIDFADTKGIARGVVGDLLGSPTVFTNNLYTASDGSPASTMYHMIYAHREATALGMQWKPEVQEQYKLERQGTLCNVRELYGIKTTRADHGVVIFRKTT